MENLISKYRLWLVAILVVFTAVAVTQFDRLRINPSFNDYIPGGVGNHVYMQKLDSLFGGNEKIMLILTNGHGIINPETFDRLTKLTDELADVDGVERCMSIRDVLEIKLEDGFTSFDPIITDISSDSVGLANLGKRLLTNEMGKRFVSKDLTATAIILSKSPDVADNKIVPDIQQVIDVNPGDDQIYLGGLPYIRQSIKSYIKTDLLTLLPAALVLMVLMLYFSFREWKGVVLPFVVVILSIVFSFGLMGALGWEISLISVLLPIMLIAIANDYSIHLINLYQEKYREGSVTGLKEIAVLINRELRKPIVITALTTIGGMLGLLSHKMAPAAQLGILASFGIGTALLMSLYLVPVLLTFYRKPKVNRQENEGKISLVDRILNRFSTWISKAPKTVLGTFAGVAILSVGGMMLLKVDTNVESYFTGKSDIKKGIELVNQKFGGSQYVSVLFAGDVLAPETLKRMDEYTQKMETVSGIGNIISPSIFMRELSKGLNEPGEPGYGQLPQSEAEAEQYLELISMSGYEGQVSQFIDYNYQHARILVSLTDGSNQTGKKVLKALKDMTKGDPNVAFIAGPGLSKIQIADMVIQGQISSMILALLIIFILLTIIFKSFAAGTKGSLPLLLSSLFLFGLMGVLNIPLDIVTALLSSIMIGVGVDYTIHFLWRYKAEYIVCKDRSLAVTKTLQTAGRGIVFNALSVIVGFSALIFSSFAPLRFFGVLVVVSIFACLICALLLIPAIIVVYKPKFLEF
ncbi:efflux RND transporter permease subunit [Mangrovibacterium diazotrophicum]|uniref:efflux RND transporter permease subunit n=1 Tax=Mangrovibacterium diazotrophicum TaxID=1261403 RepID=UPI001FE7BD2A|nr:MMPL family transporter [Mangrovibacterium diazotrophicum]